MFKTGSLEQTFLCKSSRGLVSQNPVLAMVTAEDRGLMHGRCSYLSTGVDGGLEQSRAARTAINKDRWAHWLGRGQWCDGQVRTSGG